MQPHANIKYIQSNRKRDCLRKVEYDGTQETIKDVKYKETNKRLRKLIMG